MQIVQFDIWNGNFKVLSQEETGVYLKSDVRDLETVTIQNEEYLIVASNNDELKTYKVSKRP